MAHSISSVLVTGAGGNLGAKVVAHLATLDWCKTIYCLDVKPMAGAPFDSPKIVPVVADLGDAHDSRWHAAVEAADGIVHFAVRNPAPNGSWDDTVIAIDMTANLLEHANPKGCRFVYASSNHTMGGYKDKDWAATGLLSCRTPPLPGTRYFAGGDYRAPNMYGGSKLTGERLLRAKAIASNGVFTGVGIRVGWTLRGENNPKNINAEGGGRGTGGAVVQPADEALRDLIWFRTMWLSNRDLVGEFAAALTADAAGWPEPGIVVNGTSASGETIWNLDDVRTWLGYEPQDNVWTELGIPPQRSPL